MSKEWKDADIKEFRKFWKGSCGKLLKDRMESYAEDWLDIAMQQFEQEKIKYFVDRAAGVKTLIQDFDLLCEVKKKKEDMNKK